MGKFVGYVFLIFMAAFLTALLAREISHATSDVMGRTLHTLEPKK